jgi:hypothetical protein
MIKGADSMKSSLPKNAQNSALSSPIRIIKKIVFPKLSGRAKGELTYHIGHDDKNKSLLFHVTANTGGGFFSKEWISLDNIIDTIDEQDSDIFRAILFIPLYTSKGANNHGFLAAALRSVVRTGNCRRSTSLPHTRQRQNFQSRNGQASQSQNRLA